MCFSEFRCYLQLGCSGLDGCWGVAMQLFLSVAAVLAMELFWPVAGVLLCKYSCWLLGCYYAVVLAG